MVGREGRVSGGWEDIGGVRATEGGESERVTNGGRDCSNVPL